MAHRVDPLKGLNPDQSGPLEKIQNGDPKAAPDRDQRSGAAEAGGPNPSLAAQDLGEPDTVAVDGDQPNPPGVTGTPAPEGATNRAGHASYERGVLKDATDGPAPPIRSTSDSDGHHLIRVSKATEDKPDAKPKGDADVKLKKPVPKHVG